MKTRILTALALAPLLLVSPLGASTQGDEEAVKDQDTVSRENRLRLDYHPIAPVIPKGALRFRTLMPMVSPGFRADQTNLYLAPVYGLGDGWQIGAGLTGMERIGRGGEALIPGFGVQKQLWHERKGRPALSIGGFGTFGPHNHNTGTLYLTASKQVWSSGSGKQALFLHGGVKGEFFTSDDYRDDNGVRPFFGVNFTLAPRLFLGAEVSPRQDWQRDEMFAVRATYLVKVKRYQIGVSGGIRNNGYETEPFVGLVF
jgi:hypothetical protein